MIFMSVCSIGYSSIRKRSPIGHKAIGLGNCIAMAHLVAARYATYYRYGETQR
jgi:hypothetical protein